MDTLSLLLRDVCPREARFERAPLEPTGRRYVGGEGPLTLVVPLGSAVGLRPAGPSESLGDPDLVLPADTVTLLLGRRRYVLAGGSGDAGVLTGTFAAEGSLCDRILAGLPELITAPADQPRHPVTMVITELAAERPGRQAILDQLLGLLMITTLRDWLAQPGNDAPHWYRAQQDPVVGGALQRIHDDPARPWTVGDLARESAVSRAAFARRFTDLVGEPPMSYLACWRTCLAADLLEQTDDTVAAIARQVGYADADALSVAFRRIRGVRPSDHRSGSRRRPAA